jgi:hypothetical protein
VTRSGATRIGRGPAVAVGVGAAVAPGLGEAAPRTGIHAWPSIAHSTLTLRKVPACTLTVRRALAQLPVLRPGVFQTVWRTVTPNVASTVPSSNGMRSAPTALAVIVP